MTTLACLAALCQAQEDGFTLLFNGKDMSGWKFHFDDKKAEPEKVFSVEGDAIKCLGKPSGYMYTERKFKDFTLKFDWRYPAVAGNSGYLLWIGDEHKVWPYSLECQGMHSGAGVIFFIHAKEKGKNQYRHDAAARKQAIKDAKEWNSYEIVAKGGQVLVSINGTLVTTVLSHEYTEPGHIGFQSEGAEIHWKNIRIKEEK